MFGGPFAKGFYDISGTIGDLIAMCDAICFYSNSKGRAFPLYPARHLQYTTPITL